MNSICYATFFGSIWSYLVMTHICTRVAKNINQKSTIIANYCTSANSFCGIFFFLIVENSNFNFLPNKLNFCSVNYSREETIQGQNVFAELQLSMSLCILWTSICKETIHMHKWRDFFNCFLYWFCYCQFGHIFLKPKIE